MQQINYFQFFSSLFFLCLHLLFILREISLHCYNVVQIGSISHVRYLSDVLGFPP